MKLMTTYRPDDIRNIALLGPQGVGKTTLAEALLMRTGAIARMGSIAEATTVGDFDSESRRHHFSTQSTLLYGAWEGREINVIDTPGHPELVGQALAVLPAVETAVLVVDAVLGVDAHARRLFDAAGTLGLARMVVVNRIDQAAADLPYLLASLRTDLGPNLHCITLPVRSRTDVIDCFDHDVGHSDFGSVADVHRAMLESTIEVDDAEVERYFAGEKIDLQALRRCFVQAMIQGHVIPVLFTASRTGVGVAALLHMLAAEGPSPASARPRPYLRAGAPVALGCDASAPLLGHIFKVTTDPKLGRLAMVRILQGTLEGTSTFVVTEGHTGSARPSATPAAERKPHRANQVLKIEGAEWHELGVPASAGDIVALSRVEGLRVGELLHSPAIADDIGLVAPTLPDASAALLIEAAEKRDAGKLGVALAHLVEEDPTLHLEVDPEGHGHLVRGLGP
ncbi:MAG: GTP-binding protein, partial [Deltaproteobacteria bacterium]|nr:GTP-binding protein [Deltaproteobacteria bacterium]